MLYTYKELRTKYKQHFVIEQKLKDKDIFKIDSGLYSDSEQVPYMEIIRKKYPKAIVSSDTAFYYHNLTNNIPDKIFLTTDRNYRRIKDNRIIQLFASNHLYDLGKENILHNGVTINIYNKERMLIELVKNRKNMPYDYYKEIISNYREIADDLDIELITSYLEKFQYGENIFETIHREVF